MISYPAHVMNWATRVLESGKSGTPIVFVHGTGGRADRWQRNLDAAASAGYHAYAVDLPGHGFAGKGAGFDYSVPGYTKFLGAFMDQMQLEKAVIVGTSLGGHVVASYAAANPGRMAAMVLSGSMGLVPVGDEARGRIQKGANNQTYEGVKEKLHRVIFDPALITEAFIDEEYRINNSHGAAESFRQLGEYIGTKLDNDVVGPALTKSAAQFPTLLVWGAEDKTVAPTVGETANKLIEGSKLVLLDKAAHTSYYERADDFNAILLDFLGGKFGRHRAEGVTYR